MPNPTRETVEGHREQLLELREWLRSAGAATDQWCEALTGALEALPDCSPVPEQGEIAPLIPEIDQQNAERHGPDSLPEQGREWTLTGGHEISYEDRWGHRRTITATFASKPDLKPGEVVRVREVPEQEGERG